MRCSFRQLFIKVAPDLVSERRYPFSVNLFLCLIFGTDEYICASLLVTGAHQSKGAVFHFHQLTFAALVLIAALMLEAAPNLLFP